MKRSKWEPIECVGEIIKAQQSGRYRIPDHMVYLLQHIVYDREPLSYWYSCASEDAWLHRAIYHACASGQIAEFLVKVHRELVRRFSIYIFRATRRVRTSKSERTMTLFVEETRADNKHRQMTIFFRGCGSVYKAKMSFDACYKVFGTIRIKKDTRVVFRGSVKSSLDIKRARKHPYFGFIYGHFRVR